MSLQVWLPLTKDLRQQGLSNVTVTNNGATFSENGKLGGCYRFSTTGNGSNLSIPSNTMSNFTASNGCSLAFWIKLNTWYSSYATFFQAGTGSNPWSNYIFGVLRNATNSTVCFTIGNGSTASNNNYLTSAWETGVWFHMAFTYETGKCKIYKNGVLDKEYTTSIVPDFSKITKITVGRCNNDASYQTDCEMNDVRIYDHCLSPMEVKQLSQGLVLHYPLSDKFLEDTTNLLSKNLQNFTVNGTNDAAFYQYTTPEHGIYTLSLDAKRETTDDNWAVPRISIMGYDGNASFNYTADYNLPKDGKWHHHVLKLDVSDTSKTLTSIRGWILDHSSGTTSKYISIHNAQLEFKDHETGYTENTRNSNTVYDCSGFCNNGTKWAYDTNGIIEIAADTPKYQVSTYINSTNNTTNTASGTQYIYGNCELTTPQYLTVAFWCKPIAGYGNGTAQGQFSLTKNAIGASAGEDYSACPMNHRDGYIDMCTSTDVHKTMNISFTANEWHHYVITYDGRYGRVYKDGVATGQTLDMGSVLPLKNMKGAVIGFSKAGGVWRSNKSYYSDFRIYATALSADDVKSLYQNCATIDPDGTIRGQIRS